MLKQAWKSLVRVIRISKIERQITGIPCSLIISLLSEKPSVCKKRLFVWPVSVGQWNIPFCNLWHFLLSSCRTSTQDTALEINVQSDISAKFPAETHLVKQKNDLEMEDKRIPVSSAVQ